jgi:polysaccharide export outer membrane protein
MMRRLTTIATFAILAAASLLPGRADDQLHQRPRYRLRPGDTLELQYRLTPDQNQTVIVEPDGYINLNIAGEVPVGGLTVTQAHDLIVQRDSEHLNNPDLNLILKDFTHPYIVVAGEVQKPGQVDLKENTTALSAILQAGGFTMGAQSGQVLVFRRVNDSLAEVKKLNLTRIKKTAQLERDMPLQAGDMVLVPHDKISTIEHYMSVTNVGFLFNPMTALP